MFRTVFYDPPCDLTAYISDLTLQISYTCLASVGTDDLSKSIFFKDDLLFSEPGGLTLFFHQVLLGNLEFLKFGVAVQTEDLHAVLQRTGDRVEDIGCRYEQDLGEIVFDVEIVVLEGRVLFRIEHFKQGTRRVAAEVRRHLVNFVEHEDGVLGASLLHGLDDLPGKCGDVRESPLRRERRLMTCGRTCGRSPWRSTFRGRSCRHPEGRQSRGWSPWGF